MINQISTKTRFGWISTFENHGKIFKIKFGRLEKIKAGHALCCGRIAKKFKFSPRHIGKICAQNNLLFVVPCHRVIRTDGTLGGFSSIGGIKLKKRLLEFEKTWII